MDVISSVRRGMTVCNSDTVFRSDKGDGISLVGCVCELMFFSVQIDINVGMYQTYCTVQ